MPKRPSPLDHLRKLTHVPDPQARHLAAVSLLMLVFIAISTSLQLLIIGYLGIGAGPVLAVVVVLLVMYAFSRTRYHHLGPLLGLIAAFALGVSNTTLYQTPISSLMMFGPILVATLFFSGRFILLVTVLIVITNIFLLRPMMGQTYENGIIVFFLALTGAVLALQTSLRSRSERALREAEARYRALFDGSMNQVFVHDLEGGFVDANESALLLLGYTRDDIAHLNLAGLIVPEDLPLALQTIQIILETGIQQEPTAFRLRHRDGSLVYVETMSSLIHRPNQPPLIQGIARDITRRQQAEIALRESESRLRSLVENMQDIVWSIDLSSMKMVYLNPAIERITGRPAAEFMADPGLWFAITHPDDRLPERDKDMEHVLETGGNEWEGRIIRPDGAQRWMYVRNWLVRDEQGRPVRVEGIASDITARRLAQQQEIELTLQKERIRLMSAFIQNAAHEFRTPLTTIITGAYLMSRSEDGHYRAGKVQNIEQQVKRITRLIDMLLSMVKIEGSGLPAAAPVDVRQLLDMTCEQYLVLYGNQPALRYEARSDLPPVQGDAGYLAEALRHILDNAYRFTPEDGAITVSYGMASGYVWLEVCDTGPGIPAAEQPRVFDMFWRLDEAHSTPGFGLGLTIAHKIIALHGGRIDVDSTEGIGSRFRVLLPADANERVS